MDPPTEHGFICRLPRSAFGGVQPILRRNELTNEATLFWEGETDEPGLKMFGMYAEASESSKTSPSLDISLPSSSSEIATSIEYHRFALKHPEISGSSETSPPAISLPCSPNSNTLWLKLLAMGLESEMKIDESEELEETVKTMLFIMYKWHEGPVLYTLYRFDPFQCTPSPILEMRRGLFPHAMGIIELDSTLYIAGGRFRRGKAIHGSRMFYSVDLTLDKPELKPMKMMNAPKPYPLIVAVNRKIYVLGGYFLHLPRQPDRYKMVPEELDLVDDIGFPKVHTCPEGLFEMYDPECEEWIVLPIPWSFEALLLQGICSHAILDSFILLMTHGREAVAYNTRTDEWICPFPSNPVNLHQMVGRGLLVGDYLHGMGDGTVLNFHCKCTDTAILIDESLPVTRQTIGLQFPIELEEYEGRVDVMRPSTALVYLGHGRFALLLREPTKGRFGRSSGSKRIRMSIFEMERSIHCRKLTFHANILESRFLNFLNGDLGSIHYSFAQ